MHWLDRASAAALARTPPHRRVFRDGWGDADVLDWYASIVRTPPRPGPIQVEEVSRFSADGLVVTDLRFESPAEHLPPASRIAGARLVSAEADPFRVCLLMAAWNDHGYRTRSRLARRLAARGIATVMLENPLYGERRPRPGDDRPLATVSEFAVMGRAAVVEGVALLSHLRTLYPSTGVGGFSMGGNIAAFVGVLAGFPTAIAPIAGSHSPGPPFTQGVLRRAVAFDALGSTPEEAERLLSRFLHSASVLDHDPPRHTAAAVLVAGTSDGFVPTAAVQAVQHHWPGARTEWVHTGHAGLLWRHKDLMASATAEAFDRLDSPGSSTGRDRRLR